MRLNFMRHALLSIPLIYRCVLTLSIALIMSSLFGSAIVRAEEHLEPIKDVDITLDANLAEWRTTRHSAEYLVKGLVATPNDMSGALYLTFSERWLYLGFEGRDDVLLSGRRGDLIKLYIADHRGKRQITFTLQVGDLNKPNKTLKLLRGRRAVRDATVKSALNRQGRGGTYTIEARIPMRAIPWLFGSAARITAFFIDRDLEREESSYATHFSSRGGLADETTFIFGGALSFKQIYQQERPHPIITELYHDWVGDERAELCVVTSAEVLLFGHQVRRGSRYARAVHGLTLDEKTRVRIEGDKPRVRVIISHYDVQTKQRRDVAYRLKRGRLKRIRP